jgi:hypothetical protein
MHLTAMDVKYIIYNILYCQYYIISPIFYISKKTRIQELKLN